MPEKTSPREVWKGKHLEMVTRGSWEYATRKTKQPAVGIVPLTADNRVVLVEQYRPPVESHVVELPAGLSGDVAGAENEPLVEAARRELLEETGYVAERWTELGKGYSSPGLTDESIVLFLAEGLQKVSPGGGIDGESIRIHEVPFDGVVASLTETKRAADLKLLAGLYAAQDELAKRKQ